MIPVPSAVIATVPPLLVVVALTPVTLLVTPSGLVTSLERTSIRTAVGLALETIFLVSGTAMRGVAVGLDVGELVGCE